MLRALALAVLMLPAVAASAQSVESCPTLPADSGLEWVYHEGPDFDVCHAIELASKKQAFGIYLGNHPSFNTTKGTKATTGRIAGKRVVWYRGDGNGDESNLSLQTVLTLGRRYKLHASLAHVWVSADNEPLLRQRLEILQRIDFKD